MRPRAVFQRIGTVVSQVKSFTPRRVGHTPAILCGPCLTTSWQFAEPSAFMRGTPREAPNQSSIAAPGAESKADGISRSSVADQPALA